MDYINEDLEFNEIVKNIMENKKFNKIKECKHHGITRYEHSLRVAYYSYLITKKLRLNYIETARGGLLHDFFLVDNKEFSMKEKLNTLVNHPKYAEAFASKYFDLSAKEKDIILTHMFPVAVHTVPKYAESWIVDIVDNIVAIFEALYSKRGYAVRFANVMLIVLINYLKI